MQRQFIPDLLGGAALEKKMKVGFLRSFTHETSTWTMPTPPLQVVPCQIAVVEYQPREQYHFKRATQFLEFNGK